MSTLLRLAARSHRTGLVAIGTISALAGSLNAFGLVQVGGATPAERLAFAHQMEIIGRQFSYLLPPPVQLDTMGGYLTWRNFSSLAIVFTVWAVLAATGATRGDEERGRTDLWLSSGVSRPRWLVGRTVGFVVVSLATVALMLLGTAAATAAAGEPLPAGALLLEGVVFVALTFCAFGIGLVVAQLFLTRRAAALAAAGLLVPLFLINSASRSGVEIGAARWLSPFYYFDRSTPLLSGGGLDAIATAALFAIGAVLVVLAGLAFVHRDVGSTLIAVKARTGSPTARPSGDPLLRMPILAMVDQQRGWIAGWSIGFGVLAYFLVSITKVVLDSMATIPSLKQYFTGSGIFGYSDFVGVIWFGTALLILASFIVVQVSGWAADDAEGRLELTVAQPVSRTRVVLERLAALLVAVGIMVTVSTLVVYAAARANGITLPPDRTALAGVLMMPVAFAFGGVGGALVGWRPRVAVAVLALVAATSYFTEQFAPIFSWPEWARRTSIFDLYGQPMSRVDWLGVAILMGIGLGGTAISVAAMRRRDIGT